MIYTIEEARKQILAVCRVLQQERLIVRTWGNVSARVSEQEFLITPSGKDYGRLTGEDLPLVRIRDLKWEGKWKPSSEMGMHGILYRHRPDCGFIIHTHQTNASSLSILGEDLELEGQSEDLVTQEERAVLGPAVPCAAYGLSATDKLARNVDRAARRHPDCRSVLMRYHGAVCLGETHEEAMEAARALEAVCGRIYDQRCGRAVPSFAGAQTGREWNDGYLIHCRTPYVTEMSWREKPLHPYLDDMAQIGGTSVRCLGEVPGAQSVRRALQGRNAVLVKGDGALCYAATQEEAEAVALVLEKNCQAAYLAAETGVKPLAGRNARKDRSVYLRSYARLKEEDDGEQMEEI